MPHDPIASRYAHALFESAKAQGELDETLAQLTLIGGLMQDHPDLRQLILNPDVEPEDKVGLLERTLKGSWSALVGSFVQMVVSFGRAEFVPEIVEALQALVDADRAHLRVTVRSAHPLPEAVLHHLRRRLEEQERKHVHLESEVDAALIGGLQVILGHRVLDGSIQRQLINLRERLMAVRVY